MEVGGLTRYITLITQLLWWSHNGFFNGWWRLSGSQNPHWITSIDFQDIG
jgi:hypothetical protein